MKAYIVWSDYEDDSGQLIIFEATRNKAKMLGHGQNTFEDHEYLDMRAKRAPEFDEYATVEPSEMVFCKNPETFYNKDWWCNNIAECDNEKCLFVINNVKKY